MNLDSIVERASGVKAGRVALAVISAPFWVVGFVVAMLWVVLVLMWAAAATGFDDGRSRVRSA